jgi:undecaprenyl diphosphate synthase
MAENNIRLNVIGQIDRLPEDVRRTLADTIAFTAGNTGLVLSLALSYGGRAEIVDMVRTIAQKIADGRLRPEDITDRVVSAHLYTRDLPDPDLLIRTSGEMRISNFLLWQLAYTELFITKTLWPDFGREEFFQIIERFQHRDRRYGRVAHSQG